MKGYFTAEGYMGLVEDRYILFADEADYLDSVGNAKKTLNFRPICDIMSILGILYAHAEKSENTNGR